AHSGSHIRRGDPGSAVAKNVARPAKGRVRSFSPRWYQHSRHGFEPLGTVGPGLYLRALAIRAWNGAGTMLNIVLLMLCGAVAIARPLWGFAVYLLLEHTLFLIGPRFTTVLLPAGSVSSADALPLAILAGAIVAQRRMHDSKPFAGIARRALTRSLVPFVAWT